MKNYRLTLCFLASFACVISADSNVGVKYKNQILTSSTVQWNAVNGDPAHLEYAVTGSTNVVPGAINSANSDELLSNAIYVCRIRHDGVYIPGQLRPKYKECTASLHGFIHHSPRYQILHNTENGGLLTWMPWNKFIDIPNGALTGSPETFIARVSVMQGQDEGAGKKLGYTHFLGKLDPKENLGTITVVNDQDKEVKYEQGEVLVETEPTRYELTNVRYSMGRKREKKDARVLSETILRNEGDTDSISVDSALAYNYTYVLSWGRINAVIKGLNTTVRAENGTVVDEMGWGLPRTEHKQDVYKVEMFLEPGTATNVTLDGNYTDRDVPYSATLISFYPEGVTKSRTVNAIKNEVGMMDVNAVYSAIYFLMNNTLVPTTTTTTTTTSTTTTTTTEAPMPEEPPEEPKTLKKKEEELMSTPKKGENQSMMSDEGNPETLKKKDLVQQASILGAGSSNIVTPSLIMLVAALCTGVRQLL